MAASQYLWHVLAGMYPRSCRASVKVNGAAWRRPEVEPASWSCVTRSTSTTLRRWWAVAVVYSFYFWRRGSRVEECSGHKCPPLPRLKGPSAGRWMAVAWAWGGHQADARRVHLLSLGTQTQPKFWGDLRPDGHETDTNAKCLAILGHGFCPHR